MMIPSVILSAAQNDRPMLMKGVRGLLVGLEIIVWCFVEINEEKAIFSEERHNRKADSGMD